MGQHTRTHIPIYEARPRHTLLPSQTSPLFMAIARILSPAYLRFILKFHRVLLHQPEALLTAFRHFQQGQTRLIFAFRHPYGDEPQLLQYVFDCLVPKAARKAGQPLPSRPHVRFVHGYEVALWGDAIIRLALPLSGALPIHHLQADPSGMKRIREVLLHGDCPLALAPEGQVSYRSGAVPRLEPGTARMGFWCAKDLEKDGRKEQAVIVPVSVHHAFHEKDAKKLIQLVEDLEAFCGVSQGEKSDKATSAFQGKHLIQNPGFRQETRNRLVKLETSLLALAETHYHTMCVHTPPPVSDSPSAEAPRSASSLSDPIYRQARWDALMETALQAGERILGLPVRAEEKMPSSRDALLEARIARVYRIRREGWERVYPLRAMSSPVSKPVRHRLADEAALSQSMSHRLADEAALSQSMSHRLAGEAWYAMRHMEFVDIMEYLDTAYLDAEKDLAGPSFNRLCETALNLHDLAHRLAGGNFTNRINPLRKTAVVLAGDPIHLSERLPAYRDNMRKAAQEVTDELKMAFESLINTYERRSAE